LEKRNSQGLTSGRSSKFQSQHRSRKSIVKARGSKEGDGVVVEPLQEKNTHKWILIPTSIEGENLSALRDYTMNEGMVG